MTKVQDKALTAYTELIEATKEAHSELKQLNHAITEGKRTLAEVHKAIDAGITKLVSDRMDKIEQDMLADQERLMAEIIECLDTVTRPIKSALDSHR